MALAALHKYFLALLICSFPHTLIPAAAGGGNPEHNGHGKEEFTPTQKTLSNITKEYIESLLRKENALAVVNDHDASPFFTEIATQLNFFLRKKDIKITPHLAKLLIEEIDDQALQRGGIANKQTLVRLLEKYWKVPGLCSGKNPLFLKIMNESMHETFAEKQAPNPKKRAWRLGAVQGFLYELAAAEQVEHFLGKKITAFGVALQGFGKDRRSTQLDFDLKCEDTLIECKNKSFLDDDNAIKEYIADFKKHIGIASINRQKYLLVSAIKLPQRLHDALVREDIPYCDSLKGVTPLAQQDNSDLKQYLLGERKLKEELVIKTILDEIRRMKEKAKKRMADNLERRKKNLQNTPKKTAAADGKIQEETTIETSPSRALFSPDAGKFKMELADTIKKADLSTPEKNAANSTLKNTFGKQKHPQQELFAEEPSAQARKPKPKTAKSLFQP